MAEESLRAHLPADAAGPPQAMYEPAEDLGNPLDDLPEEMAEIEPTQAMDEAPEMVLKRF